MLARLSIRSGHALLAPRVRSQCLSGARFPLKTQVLRLSSGFPRRGHGVGLNRSRAVLQRLRRMCSTKPDPEAAEAAEEGLKRSVPQLLMGMGVGVAGCWVGLGMFGGAIYMVDKLGDNSFAGRVQALLILGTFVFPPVVGAVAFSYVIQAEWSIAYFFGPAFVLYAVPTISFLQSLKSGSETRSDTRAKISKLQNVNFTDLRQLHAATVSLCDKMNSTAVGVEDNDHTPSPFGQSWGSSSFETSSQGGSSFGSSSFAEKNVIVSPDNYDSLMTVLRGAFQLGAKESAVLTKGEFYTAMNKSNLHPDQRELLMFFNRVTTWGMRREVDFREFAFTMLFYIARSEDNLNLYQESVFQFLDTQAMGSVGAKELAEMIEMTEAHFGGTKKRQFNYVWFGERTAVDTAEEAIVKSGRDKSQRLEMEEFKQVMTDLGYQF